MPTKSLRFFFAGLAAAGWCCAVSVCAELCVALTWWLLLIPSFSILPAAVLPPISLRLRKASLPAGNSSSHHPSGSINPPQHKHRHPRASLKHSHHPIPRAKAHQTSFAASVTFWLVIFFSSPRRLPLRPSRLGPSSPFVCPSFGRSKRLILSHDPSSSPRPHPRLRLCPLRASLSQLLI